MAYTHTGMLTLACLVVAMATVHGGGGGQGKAPGGGSSEGGSGGGSHDITGGGSGGGSHDITGGGSSGRGTGGGSMLLSSSGRKDPTGPPKLSFFGKKDPTGPPKLFSSGKDSKYCSNPVPGVKRQISGIDITKLDVYVDSDATGVDGFRQPVVAISCDQGHTVRLGGEEYEQPDQVSRVTPRNMGAMTYNTDIMKSTSDVKHTMEVNAHIKASSGFLIKTTFSASLDYKDLSETVTKKESFITQVSAKVFSADIDFISDNLEMDPVAKEAAMKITQDFFEDPEPYNNFIETYGTHFFRSARFGGVIRSVQTTDEEFLSTHTDKEIEANADAKFGEWLEAKGGTKIDDEKETEEYSKSTEQKVQYFGGNINLLDQDQGLKAWPATVAAHPWLLGGELVPITDLIEDKMLEQRMIIAVKQYSMLKYLDEIQRTIVQLRQVDGRDNPVLVQLYNRAKLLRNAGVLHEEEVLSLGTSVEIFNDSGFTCKAMTTVKIQNRVNGDVNFNRPWEDFKYGFGDVNGDYWIGLEALRGCCNNDDDKHNSQCVLYVNMKYKGLTFSSMYRGVSVGSEEDSYRLHAALVPGGTQKSAGDGLALNIDQPFSTPDRSSQWPNRSSCGSCASVTKTGWWHDATACQGPCRGNMHGQWLSKEEHMGVNWDPLTGQSHSLDMTYITLKVI